MALIKLAISRPDEFIFIWDDDLIIEGGNGQVLVVVWCKEYQI